MSSFKNAAFEILAGRGEILRSSRNLGPLRRGRGGDSGKKLKLTPPPTQARPTADPRPQRLELLQNGELSFNTLLSE
jgi:hypothetical protein